MKNIGLAKELRKKSTIFEKKLWFYLRSRRFKNYKFRRQVPIGNYIVDFMCEEKKLIIELDGSQHNIQENIEKDIIRSEYLINKGFRVIRFWNDEIGNSIDIVLDCIYQKINE